MNNRTPQGIQGEMSTVRQALGRDVDHIVDGTQRLMDWKYQVRSHPWLCVGAAAAAGFLILPKKTSSIKPDVEQLARLADKNRLIVSQATRGSTGSGLARAAALFLGRTLLRAAVSHLAARKAVEAEADDLKEEAAKVPPRLPR